MRRLDKELNRLEMLEKEGNDVKMDITARIQLLMPTYRNIAITFADLHDTAVRMKAVGAIKVLFLFRNGWNLNFTIICYVENCFGISTS